MIGGHISLSSSVSRMFLHSLPYYKCVSTSFAFFLISRGNISLFRVSNHAVEGEARSFSLNSDFIFISLILLFIDQGDLLHSYYGYTKSSNLQVRFISDHASSVRLRLEFFVVIVRL